MNFERRLGKLEAEIDRLQRGATHLAFANEEEPAERPPNFKEGDKLIVVRWISPDEAIPSIKEQDHDA